MYTQKEYMEKAEEANRKNQQLYIFGTGESNEDGTFDGKLIIADTDYYICKSGTNVTDGEPNPKYEPIKEEETLNALRAEREKVCFSVINRGKLWYDALTLAQADELNKWYLAWLKVTETYERPKKPSWL